MTSAIQDGIDRFLWSLWSELGVPGVERRHRSWAIDPEALIYATPGLSSDARLHLEVLRWSAAHGQHVSASRLKGLANLPQEPDTAFADFAATLGAISPVRWAASRGVADKPLPRLSQTKAPALPIERPAMVYFRFRGLCGVGARADVLVSLLSNRRRKTTALDLTGLGYSKRNVARMLSSLCAAGWVRQVDYGHTHSFVLREAETFAQLAAANDLKWPAWPQLFELLRGINRWDGLVSKSLPLQRVQVNQTREALRRLSETLELEPPPVTRGVRDPLPACLAWGEQVVVELAEGSWMR
ncbi:MAG: hypothetical protein KC502_13665 [Myxococcales bacterium]|nr:hypothetical protein [Myxococcales bacterium]